MTLCDFQIREALHPRDSHRYTVQCVLPLNLFSQQVQIVLMPYVLFERFFVCLDFHLYLVLVHDGLHCGRCRLLRRIELISRECLFQSIFDVLVWVTRFLPAKQYNYIKRRLQLMKRDTDFNSQPPEYVKRWYTEFIFEYLEPDGVFMLRLLSSNTSDFVCTEVSALRFDRFHRSSLISRQGNQSVVACLLHARFQAVEA